MVELLKCAFPVSMWSTYNTYPTDLGIVNVLDMSYPKWRDWLY
jgi:hypothetical protein